MSRIVITNKRNGRYYIGMGAEDFAALREMVLGEVGSGERLARNITAEARMLVKLAGELTRERKQENQP